MNNQFKKKKFSYKDILYKGKRLGALCLILVFGAGLIVTSHMNSEIPVHDGDVLVDSLAVSGEENKAGTFEEMRAKLDLERNKLLSSLDSEAEKKRITGYMEKANVLFASSDTEYQFRKSVILLLLLLLLLSYLYTIV